MTLRVGIGLFTGQVPPGSGRTFAQEYRDTLELVRLAESLGFDSAWVSEHHGASDGYRRCFRCCRRSPQPPIGSGWARASC